MLDAIAPLSEDTVCFLGDYIDRGPAPKAVVDRLIQLQAEGPECVFLKGNHEDMFLAYLGYPGHYGEVFIANGGGPTVRSYGMAELEGTAAAALLPENHREFYRALRTHAWFDDF